MARKKIGNLMGRKGDSAKWQVVGIDVSMSSIAVAAMGWDDTLKRMRGPAMHTLRWEQSYSYFNRLEDAAHAEIFIEAAVSQLGFWVNDRSDIYVAVEEPWPMGLVKKAASQYIKQQAQVSGALLGGLLRSGYQNLWEINYQTWLNVIRAETGLKLPSSKETKWKVKEWAIGAFDTVPDLPDLIQHGKLGKIPRPEGSVAKAVQPEDIYDALGIMEYMRAYVEDQLS